MVIVIGMVLATVIVIAKANNDSNSHSNSNSDSDSIVMVIMIGMVIVIVIAKCMVFPQRRSAWLQDFQNLLGVSACWIPATSRVTGRRRRG